MNKTEIKLRNNLAEALQVPQSEVRLYGDNIFRVSFGSNVSRGDDGNNTSYMGDDVLKIVRTINNEFKKEFGTNRGIAISATRNNIRPNQPEEEELVLQLDLTKDAKKCIRFIDKLIGEPARRAKAEENSHIKAINPENFKNREDTPREK